MKLFVLLALLVGCSSPPGKPKVDSPHAPKPPGLVWTTEAQPYHIPRVLFAKSIAGDTAIIVGSAGMATKLDLRTGKVVLDKRVAPVDVQLFDIEHIANDKWLTLGITAPPEPDKVGSVVGYLIDGATLAATQIKLSTRPDKSLANPTLAVSSEGVVIAGRGLPLALYDPQTWAVKQILDTQLAWLGLEVRGTILLARNSRGITRWDLGTNGQRKLEQSSGPYAGVGAGFEATSKYDGSKVVPVIHVDGKATALKDEITGMGVDSTGKRLITGYKNEVRIHQMPGGEILKRIPLGDIEVDGRLWASGSRMVFGANGIERVVDLDAAKLLPIDDGPTAPSGIAVDPDGTVLVASHGVHRVQNGKVIARERIADAAIEGQADTKHYATSTKERTKFQLRALGTAAPIGSWDLELPRRVWVGRDSMSFESTEGVGVELKRTKGASLSNLARLNRMAVVIGLDPDGDALIAVQGNVAVVGPDGKARSRIRVPSCSAVSAWGVVEAGGTRAATYDLASIAIWDRTSGKLLGAAEFDHGPRGVVFLPKREEIAVFINDKLHFWVPGKSIRTHTLTGLHLVAASSDGKRIAIAFYDGRVAVYDVDSLLGSLTAGTQPKAATLKDSCGTHDPLGQTPDADGVEGGEEGGTTPTPDPNPCGD